MEMKTSEIRRIEQTLRGENPFFVRELETGYVVIGDHQRFEGYTLLLCKEHATELSQLTPEFRAAFLRDMAITAEAVEKAFKPDKMNYAANASICTGTCIPAGRGILRHPDLCGG